MNSTILNKKSLKELASIYANEVAVNDAPSNLKLNLKLQLRINDGEFDNTPKEQFLKTAYINNILWYRKNKVRYS